MNRYRLAATADDDVLVLYMQGAQQFGERQADRYHDELIGVFERLADFPRIGRVRIGVDPPIRALSHGAHVVVYREEPGGVLILRVRHGHEDWQDDPIGSTPKDDQ